MGLFDGFFGTARGNKVARRTFELFEAIREHARGCGIDLSISDGFKVLSASYLLCLSSIQQEIIQRGKTDLYGGLVLKGSLDMIAHVGAKMVEQTPVPNFDVLMREFLEELRMKVQDAAHLFALRERYPDLVGTNPNYTQFAIVCRFTEEVEIVFKSANTGPAADFESSLRAFAENTLRRLGIVDVEFPTHSKG